MTPDLHQLRQRLGGWVLAGGLQWIGPGPGHSRSDRSLHVTVKDDGRILVKSFADDFTRDKDGFKAALDYLGLSGAPAGSQSVDRLARERVQRERHRLAAEERMQRIAWCHDVWNQTLPADGTPVAAYLTSRGIVGEIPPILRYHPAAPTSYEKANTAPAMVAGVQGPDGSPVGLHVTYIKPDGSGKAFGNKSRVMFGYFSGAAIRLAPIDKGELAVAEGIETALSFQMLTGTPTWSVLNTTTMTQFTPPADVSLLTIAADNDLSCSGLKAAKDLAQSASRHCDVQIIPAPEVGRDWNDCLQGIR